jgi:hypothetical protein
MEAKMKKHQGYSFDKIRILSGQKLKFLHKNLPKKLLKGECDFFRLAPASDMAEQFNFISSIEFVNPSKKFFRLLLEHEKDLHSHTGILVPKEIKPKISYLEIARDTFYKHEYQAVNTASELGGILRKKWPSNNFNYDAFYDPNLRDKKGKNIQGIGDKTWYYGTKKFQLVLYPRMSKINGQPCVHEEWRISGATNIKKKTGIESIADFIEFDIKKCFEEMYSKYMVYEKIDHLKLGKWILDWTRRKKLTDREVKKAKMQASLFCRHKNIKSAADLINFFKKEKNRIKAIRGRRTPYKSKMLKANYRNFVKRMPYY